MLTEKSVAVIVFRKEEDFRFLLLWKKESEHYREVWEFPKGNAEKNETEKQTALRELQEETGLTEKDLKFFDFKDKISFFYRNEAQELIKKEVSSVLCQTTKSEIAISFEHNAYRWAPYLEAFDLLTQKNTKEVLRKVYDTLKRIFRQKMIF